ncbi:hypothetical protein KDA_07970 [Dictyobacter alpinus]|uniref:Uncharacterized protein n=1 Tax=Dictyobacter alpinus TaxID=2014873 RepID=A0A402B1T9_9CHLR|nr:WD40 repeat domain-containing protein [Dictyobacter alpinus]GCE25313.1 hypothetical protein KDA_07970 [Dictyobacter alpinus]
MTDHNNEFTPEDVDEKIEQHMIFTTNEPLQLIGPEASADDRLIVDLQLMYSQGAPRATSDEDEQSLQYAWKRITEVAAVNQARKSGHVLPQNKRKVTMLQRDKQKNGLPEKKHTLQSRLVLIAAACVAIMVVGSMVLLLHNVRQVNTKVTVQQGNTQAGAGTGGGTPSPAVTPTPGFKPTTTNSPVKLSGNVGKNVYTWSGNKHGQVSGMYDLAWSLDSKRIASASLDVDVWDATTGNNVVSFQPFNSSTGGASILAVKWSPDGKYIASSKNGQIQIWDPITKAIVQTLTYPGFPPLASNGLLPTMSMNSYLGSYQQMSGGVMINDFDWSPDGKQLVATSPVPNGADSMAIWDLATQKTTTLKGHTDQVAHVVWSPDGKYIASSSYDGTVRVWDATTGTNIYTRNAPGPRAAASLAWSPTKGDERLLAGYSSGSIEIFDAPDGTHALSYSTHVSQGISAVAWSPDGKVVAAAGGGVKLLDAHKDALLYTYTGNTNYIRSMAWSPDGKYIATGDNMSDGGSANSDVKVWIAQ